jgi:hypothetical protein
MSAAGHRNRGSHARASRRRPPARRLVLLDYPDENEMVGKQIAAVGPPRHAERLSGRAMAVAAGVVVAMGSVIGGSVALDSGGGATSTLRAPAPGPVTVPKFQGTSGGASTVPARHSRRTSSASARPSAPATAVSQPAATPPSTAAAPPSTIAEPPNMTAAPPSTTAGTGQSRWPSASDPVAGYGTDPVSADQRFGDPEAHGFGSASYFSAPTFNDPYQRMWPAAPYSRLPGKHDAARLSPAGAEPDVSANNFIFIKRSMHMFVPGTLVTL